MKVCGSLEHFQAFPHPIGQWVRGMKFGLCFIGVGQDSSPRRSFWPSPHSDLAGPYLSYSDLAGPATATAAAAAEPQPAAVRAGASDHQPAAGPVHHLPDTPGSAG